MKKKFAIINFSLMIAVLFAMLFQSLHSYEHLIAQFSEVKCHQKHIAFGTQVTHEHDNIDHCFACEFTFSHFISSNLNCFKLSNSLVFFKNTFFYLKKINPFYNGISYSLRGPPNYKI